MALATNLTAPEPQLFQPLSILHKSPTCTLAALRGMLDTSKLRTIHLIEAGKIEWAWNIAASQARKAEVRVLASAVHDYQHGLVRCLTFEEVIHALYGMERPAISSSRWDWVWNCSHTHLYALVREGALDPVDSRWRTGAGGGAKITWASAVAFAKRCRVT